METTLTTYEVRYYLAILGYSDGKYPDDPPAADPTNPKYRRQIEAFQADYRELAGNPDGIYGPKTESAMLPLIKQIVAVDGWRVPAAPPETTAPAEKPAYKDMGDLRRWRLTEYWISDAVEGDIPIQDQHGNAIASVSEHSYISAALEGTIYGPDKSLINVAGGWRSVDADVYQPVYDIAEAKGWLPDKAGYAGIRIADGRVTQAMTFKVVEGGPNGYPIWKHIEGVPFRTMATDTGQMRKSDPDFKGKGVIPAGTWVFVLELYGLALPDGSTHDGWVQANDTGGAIYGAHLDLFVGHESNRGFRIPNLGHLYNGHRCHIWFEGVEKLSIDYSYGL